MKNFYLFLFLIYSYFSYSSDLEKLDGITAVVGNEIILNSEIRSNNCNALNNFLIKKLMLYYAKKDKNIQINDKELESRTKVLVSEMKKKYPNNKKEFFTQFGKKNFLLIETIKNHQYLEKFYKKITDTVEVSPEEVKHFFKKKPLISPKKICIFYIVFNPKLSLTNKKITINFLKKIKKEIHNDVDFSIKAILFSEDDDSALYGGLIKGIKINSIPKEFEHIIFSLKEKEISEPFETNLGFHLIKLEGKRKNEIDIRHILIKPKYTKDELNKTKLFVKSIKKRISNSNKEISKIYDEKNVNILGSNKICFEENKLSVNMKKALHFLKKGEISNPYKEILNGKEVFFIVKLLDSIPSYPITIEKDYTKLKNFVKDVKKENKIKNWVQKVLKKTYIKINCT
ncbi:peptidylprolyl isomerase [Blattabacterium cuenoti]|uniref:peptidylprolyl isomerase n=1 Tax=Blattabacterium cuenoti TaxID=1653831 RepID=UPI00163BE343|nr:peptidylprolyl isomerase [Blattabacterium cuenoti]